MHQNSKVTSMWTVSVVVQMIRCRPNSVFLSIWTVQRFCSRCRYTDDDEQDWRKINLTVILISFQASTLQHFMKASRKGRFLNAYEDADKDTSNIKCKTEGGQVFMLNSNNLPSCLTSHLWSCLCVLILTVSVGAVLLGCIITQYVRFYVSLKLETVK